MHSTLDSLLQSSRKKLIDGHFYALKKYREKQVILKELMDVANHNSYSLMLRIKVK